MTHQSSRKVAALVTAVLLCLPAVVFAQNTFSGRKPVDGAFDVWQLRGRNGPGRQSRPRLHHRPR